MIIFDEVDYAEAIIRNGCSRMNVLLDFNILAKYYMYYIGLSEQGTKEKMLDVLKNSDIYIPISYLLLKIDRAINFAKTETLRTMDAIPVYKEVKPYLLREKSIFKKKEEPLIDEIKESNVSEDRSSSYNDTLTFFQ